MKVVKTIKLFIGGEFPRTESGYSFAVHEFKTKNVYAQLCQASRKDFRNAVTAAQSGFHSWSSKTAFNRSQILYRMAEMFEGQRQEFTEIMSKTLGKTSKQCADAIDASIDALVYFAGFADKYQQVMGAVNPVSGPHHNFTSCEPVGVVAHIPAEKFDLPRLVSEIAGIICSGNAVVTLLPEEGAAVIAPLSEVFATSDLPKGVINLLTGERSSLISQAAEHMEVQSICSGLKDLNSQGKIRLATSGNLKRFVTTSKPKLNLESITDFVEFKTVWHPIGY